MEVWETLWWCNKSSINLLNHHMLSKSNILADQLSHVSKPIWTEWCINQTICNLILSVTVYPNIDLFVTCLNNRLPVYVSPIPDDSPSNTRSINELGQNKCIHIFPVGFDSSNNQQNSSTSVANWSESSILPQSILVPRITWLLEAFPLRLPVKQHLSIQLQIVRNNIENLRLHVWIVCANQSEMKL